MTLLTVVQDAAAEVGISAPSTVVGNSDATTGRLLAIANRGGKALAQRFPWQELTREWTLTTVAAESQGAVSTIMPGFNWDIYQTIWNRTTHFPVGGPLYPAEWEFLKALDITGPWPQFQIREGNLLLSPTPPAGQTMAGMYVSKFWCQSAGGAGQSRWAADTDTGVLSEDLLTLDLVWRWKSSIGLDYSEEKQEFEIQVNNAMARNGSNRTLNLEGPGTGYPAGLVVPQGNWSL